MVSGPLSNSISADVYQRVETTDFLVHDQMGSSTTRRTASDPSPERGTCAVR